MGEPVSYSLFLIKLHSVQKQLQCLLKDYRNLSAFLSEHSTSPANHPSATSAHQLYITTRVQNTRTYCTSTGHAIAEQAKRFGLVITDAKGEWETIQAEGNYSEEEVSVVVELLGELRRDVDMLIEVLRDDDEIEVEAEVKQPGLERRQVGLKERAKSLGETLKRVGTMGKIKE